MAISNWVEMLKKRSVVPILATCVPVTRENDEKTPGRQKSINGFNEFIRSYAQKKKLAVLDLQNALEDDSGKHY